MEDIIYLMKDTVSKILFIQKIPLAYYGVISLSSMLEASGYTTDILVTSLERKFIPALTEREADLICITAMTTERNWAKEAAVACKQVHPETPVVMGGIHAIIYPEDAISTEGVDYICNSEGEKPLRNLIDSIEHPDGLKAPLKGIWSKESRSGNIIRNQREALTDDLSRYIENRRIYYRRYPEMAEDKIQFFYSSRGCPYECAFCSNSQVNKIFPVKDRRIRFKKPDIFIEEIESEKKNSAFKSIHFTDDLFATDRAWLSIFTRLYKTRIGMPFSCQMRPEFASEETLRLLNDSGCEKIVVGIETGNERLRNDALKKRLKNEAIIDMARNIRKHGMKLQTYNIFGFPGETLENSFETIDLNVKIRTDIAASFMYIPFPDTELCRKGIKEGTIKQDYSLNDIPRSFHRRSVMRSAIIRKQEDLHKVIYLAVRFPAIIPVIRNIARNDNRILGSLISALFWAGFVISFFYRYKSREHSIWEMARFIYRCRKAY